MGVERRVQQSWVRVMARPSEMKNKRKEVDDDEVEDYAQGVRIPGENKRPKLCNDVPEASSSGLMEIVGRILEARRRKSTRPLPVLIGTKAVDLVALHSRVHRLGGYHKVTDWSSISEALGFGSECGPGLKLVFVKYLKALETDKHTISSRLDARSSELGEHSRSQNGDVNERKGNSNDSGSDGLALSDEEVIGDLRGRDHRNQLECCRQSSTCEDWATTYASVEHLDAANPSCSSRDEEGARGSTDEGPGVSEDWYEGVREENVQQQREALRGMLEWIKRVAVCPGDSDAGLGEGSSGQDDYWVSQCQMLTAKVRSVLWKEPGGGDSFNQAKQMPSLYYDDLVRPDAQTLEKLRVTRERLESFGFQPPPGPKSSHQDRNDGSYWGTAGASYPGQRSGRHAVNNYNNESAFARYNQQRKRIPIGPDFQADTPLWVPRDPHRSSGDNTTSAGEGPSGSDDDDNDDRWLGVRVWPPAAAAGAVENSSFRPVGRGRPASCDCQEPGSIHCVRVHIAAARARLWSELGPAFLDMGFDQMGECVADQCWSKEEERTFRLVARSHPASKSSNFWDYLPDALPHKTRMELNSYYFNVFMLRRRALQNRLGEGKIDSDDDEGELPGESEESEYGSTDDEDDEEDDEEEDEIFSDGADDAAESEDVHDAFPLKVPNDLGMRKFRPLPDFNYIPPEEVAHSRVQMDSSLVGLEDEAGNHIAPDNSHVVLVWDDKHLESGSLVHDDRPWGEHPHWDGRSHPEVSPVVLGEAVPSRQLSPPKEDGRQGAAALGDLWSQSMEMAPKREKDKLLSTTGMILELFGDDCECAGMLDSE